MAPSSILGDTRTQTADPGINLPVATSLLLTQLALNGEIREYKKGKGRADETQSEEFALNIQAEYLEHAFQVIEDVKLAKTFDEGVETNHPSLGAGVRDWEAADHRAVLALLAGEQLTLSSSSAQVLSSPLYASSLFNISR